jgi:muramoyltetrapeptide carboxypeptidase
MRGLAWLRTRYTLRVDERILRRDGFLAGSDEARAAVLARAMTDPSVDAIVCARGGYGAMRILDSLPWNAFGARPKWLCGFSDVTALHAMTTARGIVSVHGPNVTGMGRSMTPAERLTVLDALEGRGFGSWRGLEILHGRAPQARGVVVGGNLALVEAMAAAGKLVVPDGAMFVLEDVTERPYRIDRMLTSLMLGAYFKKASALIFGGFSRCDPGPDGATVRDVLRERTAGLGLPVLAGAPFGHGAPNEAFYLGAEAVLEGNTLRWHRGEGDSRAEGK